jgi:hypothetical protein
LTQRSGQRVFKYCLILLLRRGGGPPGNVAVGSHQNRTTMLEARPFMKYPLNID